jgi:hypothetical protein
LRELGELRLAQKRPRDAIPLFVRASSIAVKSLNKTHPQVLSATSGLGRSQLAAGDVKAALGTLTKTVAALEASAFSPVLLASTRLALAEAKWQLGDRNGAIAVAESAEPALAPNGATSNPKLRAEIARWLAKHR